MLTAARRLQPEGPAAGLGERLLQRAAAARLGRRVRGGKREAVTGEAWLDHEWSSAYLDEQATGWDWIGLNLDDGGALMAFRIRGRDGATRWAGGTLRRRRTARSRRSARTRSSSCPAAAGARRAPASNTRSSSRCAPAPCGSALEPLMDDQESDTRGSTGAIYWEGAVEAITEDRGNIGRGYLELTGYGEPLKL